MSHTWPRTVYCIRAQHGGFTGHGSKACSFFPLCQDSTTELEQTSLMVPSPGRVLMPQGTPTIQALAAG